MSYFSLNKYNSFNQLFKLSHLLLETQSFLNSFVADSFINGSGGRLSVGILFLVCV